MSQKRKKKRPALQVPPRPRQRRIKRWLRPGVFVALAVLGVIGAGVYYVLPHPFTWREEVTLPDGGTVILTWRVWPGPGELGQRPQGGRQQLTFPHPTTGQRVIWEDAGKVGSRVNPILLAVDAGRLFLVGLAPSATDYDGFGCPMPPYIVFRYDGGPWARVPFSELPSRFETANLLGFGAQDLIRTVHRYLTAAEITTWYARVLRDPTVAHHARIDRRIRNPVGLGCIRPERVYGPGSYQKWSRMGNWLNLPQAEALKLLEKGGHP